MTDPHRNHSSALAEIRDRLEALDRQRDAVLAEQRTRVLAARADGLTLQAIANIMGLTKGRISQIEKGIR